MFGEPSNIRRKHGVFLLLILLKAGSASAAIYSCEKNGVKEFSQQPCGDSEVVVKAGDEAMRIVVPMPDEDVERICRLMVKGWELAVANRTTANSRYRRSTTTVSPRDFVLSKITNLRELAKIYPSLYSWIDSTASNINYSANSIYTYQTERDRVQTRCMDDFNKRIDSAYRIRKRKQPS